MTTARTLPQDLDLPESFVQADISTPQGVKCVVENVLSSIGTIDILINNVGGSSAPNGGALALDDSDWHQALNDNLLSAVRLDRAFLPGMIEQGSGVIIPCSIYSTDTAALPIDGCIRGGKSCSCQLQQEPLKRSITKRRSSHNCFARFY